MSGEMLTDGERSMLMDNLADDPMWIGDNGEPLDYLPEREALIGDHLDRQAHAVERIIAARLAPVRAILDAWDAWDGSPGPDGRIHPDSSSPRDRDRLRAALLAQPGGCGCSATECLDAGATGCYFGPADTNTHPATTTTDRSDR